MKKWNGFEHQLHQWLTTKGWKQTRFLLAVSGGVDSMVLLAAFHQVLTKPLLGVATIHHGPCPENEIQKKFRDESLLFVQSVAEEKRIPFFSCTSEGLLKSEEEMREFRYASLQKIQKENHFDFIVLAHHLDDQAETQILHMIRGCGLQALLGMQEVQAEILRPFLQTTKDEIYAYAQVRELKYLQDPSNQELHPLRNWLRESWLPGLDKKQLGMKQSFLNSLNLIAKELQEQQPKAYDFTSGIERESFLFLPREEKKAIIYNYLKSLEVLDVSQGQIEEILKRLDKSKDELTFTMSHSLWQVQGDYIVAQKRPSAG